MTKSKKQLNILSNQREPDFHRCASVTVMIAQSPIAGSLLEINIGLSHNLGGTLNCLENKFQIPPTPLCSLKADKVIFCRYNK